MYFVCLHGYTSLLFNKQFPYWQEKEKNYRYFQECCKISVKVATLLEIPLPYTEINILSVGH